jgi:hypothetical protein
MENFSYHCTTAMIHGPNSPAAAVPCLYTPLPRTGALGKTFPVFLYRDRALLCW